MSIQKRRFLRGDTNHKVVAVGIFLTFISQLDSLVIEPNGTSADFSANDIDGKKWGGQIKTFIKENDDIEESLKKLNEAIADITGKSTDYDDCNVVVAAINSMFLDGTKIIKQGSYVEKEILKGKKGILFSGSFNKEQISSDVFRKLSTDFEKSTMDDVVEVLYCFIDMMANNTSSNDLILKKDDFFRVVKATLAKRLLHGSAQKVIDFETDKKAEEYIKIELFSEGDNLEKIERMFQAKATNRVVISNGDFSFIDDEDIRKYFVALVNKSAQVYIQMEEIINENIKN